MLKDIAAVKLAGGGFTNPIELSLFDPIDGKKIKLVKGTILYGRNGSGKSTIARAVKKLVVGGYPHITQAKAMDKDGNIISLTEDEQKRVYVFDEEFVDKNVKLQEAGLDTIVMLGQQADLTDQIAQAQNELDIAKMEYEKQLEVIQNEYENRDNPKSPEYYIDQMRYALQGDDNWAGRDKTVKDKRTNSPVKDTTYKQFLSLSPVKSRDELIIAFNDKFKELQQAQNGEASIEKKVIVPILEYNDQVVNDLLSMKIQKPELSEREKYLLQLVQNGKKDTLVKIVDDFGKESTKECPYCLQSLTKQYKKNLIDSIQKVLNKIVKEHQRKLEILIIDELTIDFSTYEKLGKTKGICEDLVNKINQMIKENNQRLQEKIDDPYTPIETEMTEISLLFENLVEALEKLEEARILFNKKVKATAPIKKELERINSEIAYYDIVKIASCYDIQQQEYESEKKKRDEKKILYMQKKGLVDELEAKRKNIKIALDVINNSLKYIFFSKDRLQIEYQNDTYILLSNGHKVKPSEVSLGERNIIALCYFFANIMQNQEESVSYNREYLLVIDDPISSFDIENKIGIMSFLKYQLGKFFLGNEHTKAIVMTHDLLTFYDLDKIFEELLDDCKEKFQGQKLKFNRFELRQQRLEVFQYKQRQEYSELVKIIYNYGLGNASDYDIIIGNMLRQVLEAFSTFQYRKGIEKVSTDPDILDDLPEDEYKVYFHSLMYRLVLHGGSHREEQVKTLDDMNFFSIISSSDKQRIARDILCFIYLLDKKHIMSHLRECGNDVVINLTKWCNDIKN